MYGGLDGGFRWSTRDFSASREHEVSQGFQLFCQAINHSSPFSQALLTQLNSLAPL